MATQALASHNSSHSHSNNHDIDNNEYTLYIPSFAELVECLNNEASPISKRMRTVFLLKQLGSADCVTALCNSLNSPSVLLAHECAYVLGQMRNRLAIPSLVQYLSNQLVDPIVRHECAEALAAIGEYEESISILKQFLSDPAQEVRDTCEIAVAKLEFNQAQLEANKANKGLITELPQSKYASVDPAPPVNIDNIDELEHLLNDSSKSLFQRYRAMFSLRDIGSDEAVLALATGFNDSSAVFRHEIAYVMGQMQNPAALSVLTDRLQDSSEHAMVRHEAAEAIGSIAETDCEPMLKQFANDKDTIVRESCDVALDLVDYWNNDEVSTAIQIQEPEEKSQQINTEAQRNITAGIPTVPFVRRVKQ
jgi:deoxyhypusine monooxygenase